MAKKPAIPSASTDNQALNQMLSAIKENLDVITGSLTSVKELKVLGTPATTDDIVSKINEIIRRLNVTGN
jgi:uncharacterized protein YfkK (UPF0435 family)